MAETLTVIPEPEVRALMTYLRRMLWTALQQSPIDAEDMLAEAYAAMWEAAQKWRPDGGASLRTWVLRPATWAAVDYRRREVVRRRRLVPLCEAPAEDGDGPRLDRLEAQRLWVEAWASASLWERRCLEGVYGTGETIRGFAALSGRPPSTIRNALARVRRRARDKETARRARFADG